MTRKTAKPKPILSLSQKKRWLKNGWAHCPYCGSEDISSRCPDFSSSGPDVCATTECDACRQEWLEVYRLVDIIPTDAAVLIRANENSKARAP